MVITKKHSSKLLKLKKQTAKKSKKVWQNKKIYKLNVKKTTQKTDSPKKQIKFPKNQKNT
jgi:hypothetical protein